MFFQSHHRLLKQPIEPLIVLVSGVDELVAGRIQDKLLRSSSSLLRTVRVGSSHIVGHDGDLVRFGRVGLVANGQ